MAGHLDTEVVTTDCESVMNLVQMPHSLLWALIAGLGCAVRRPWYTAQASKEPETGMTPQVQILLVIYCLRDLKPIPVLVSSSVE